MNKFLFSIVALMSLSYLHGMEKEQNNSSMQQIERLEKEIKTLTCIYKFQREYSDGFFVDDDLSNKTKAVLTEKSATYIQLLNSESKKNA